MQSTFNDLSNQIVSSLEPTDARQLANLGDKLKSGILVKKMENQTEMSNVHQILTYLNQRKKPYGHFEMFYVPCLLSEETKSTTIHDMEDRLQTNDVLSFKSSSQTKKEEPIQDQFQTSVLMKRSYESNEL